MSSNYGKNLWKGALNDREAGTLTGIHQILKNNKDLCKAPHLLLHHFLAVGLGIELNEILTCDLQPH